MNNKILTTTRMDDGGYIEEKEETPAVDGGGLQDALAEVDETYDGMIDQVDSFYQEQIDASKQWAKTQQQNQQAQTDFTIEQIEQQKQQAEEDYLKEQSGAYVDWQKQSGQYGANAEAMAARGMGGTGYSESAQVSMYNTYQNRVAAAREGLARATLNYDNAIKEARLQNSAILAEIAYQAYQQEIELALQGFLHKNQLVQEKAAAKKEQLDLWLQVMQLLQEEEKGNSGWPIDRDVGEGDTEEAAPGEGDHSAAKKQALADINRGGVTTYRDAVDILNRCGVDTTRVDPRLMDSSEWNKQRREGSAVEGVTSYQEYLYCYCIWAISNFA